MFELNSMRTNRLTHCENAAETGDFHVCADFLLREFLEQGSDERKVREDLKVLVQSQIGQGGA